MKKTIFKITIKCFIILIAFTNSCQKVEENVNTVDLNINPESNSKITDGMSESEKKKYFSIMLENAYENHKDPDWENEKYGIKKKQLPVSSFISRRYIGLPYANQIGNSCQSHAAATALNAFWQKKNDTKPSFASGTDGRPFNWHRSPYFIRWCMSGVDGLAFFTVTAAMNSIKWHGATHLKCMPSPGVWAPDPQFNLLTWSDVYWSARNNLSLVNNNTNWAYINNSSIAYSPSLPTNVANRLDLNHIKNAITNNRPVIVRFALINGGANSGLPVVRDNNIDNGNTKVFREEHQNNQHLSKWHVVTIVGYNDRWNAFYCQNSWGQGINGMNNMGGFYMTYETLRNRADQGAYIVF